MKENTSLKHDWTLFMLVFILVKIKIVDYIFVRSSNTKDTTTFVCVYSCFTLSQKFPLNSPWKKVSRVFGESPTFPHFLPLLLHAAALAPVVLLSQFSCLMFQFIKPLLMNIGSWFEHSVRESVHPTEGAPWIHLRRRLKFVTPSSVLSSVHWALWKGEATGCGWDVFNALINVTVAGSSSLMWNRHLESVRMLWKKADVLMEKKHPPGICKWWACICLHTPLSCQKAQIVTS